MRLLSMSLLLALLAACPPPAEEEEVFSEEPLGGEVGGEPWTFVAGDTNAFLSDDESLFSTFSQAAFAACVDPVEGPQLISALPLEVGVHKLKLSGPNVTFSPESGENIVAISGAIRIDEVTDTTISGAINAKADGNNEADGVFELTICAE
ncbi:MAG: hypothetical protein Q8O67_21260 [Deltaproteobacteria bacterium]|nr:hypothetical protein [Deltaproteobacteria bacterium]